ncbi:hypothetical protein Drorol1_Dr00000241 [Drosera rotundifolia]
MWRLAALFFLLLDADRIRGEEKVPWWAGSRWEASWWARLLVLSAGSLGVEWAARLASSSVGPLLLMGCCLPSSLLELAAWILDQGNFMGSSRHLWAGRNKESGALATSGFVAFSDWPQGVQL